jgi:hypothetical protein
MLTENSNSDAFKVAVIDTIVAEVQSTPGEDRCVLLLGYKEQSQAWTGTTISSGIPIRIRRLEQH